MPRVARPETAAKKSKNNKGYNHRLSPRECREVRTYWDKTIELKAKEEQAGSKGRPGSGHSYELPLHVAKNIMIDKLDRRNPGRGDGLQWNGDSFICSDQIDGDHDDENRDLDVDEFEDGYCDERRPSVAVSLGDMIHMARPMKVRAQEFEMIPAVTRVLIADDDTPTSDSGWEDDIEYLEDEEWEDLEPSESEESEEEEHRLAMVRRKTYAQVLLDR